MDQHFEELLLQYAHAETPEQRKIIHDRLWADFGHEKGILVMDMSGFSLLTQKFGIVHYLSMVKRMQIITAPIIEKHGGQVVKFEADNCFAEFDDVSAAVRAAIALNTAFAAVNQFTDDEFDIRVSIGIDYGQVLLIGGPDYFGDAVNRASKLGEDVAGPGEILLTESALERFPVDQRPAGELLDLSISGIRLAVLKLAYPQ